MPLQSGRYEEKIQAAQARFAESWCKFTGPLRGYKVGKIKVLGTLGAMALAGDESLRDYLKSEDRLVNKPVAVIGPDQRGRFSKALANQIVSGGKEIIRHLYREEVIQAENKKLNQEVVTLIRLASRLGYLNLSARKELEEAIAEIGKLLSGAY